MTNPAATDVTKPDHDALSSILGSEISNKVSHSPHGAIASPATIQGLTPPPPPAVESAAGCPRCVELEQRIRGQRTEDNCDICKTNIWSNQSRVTDADGKHYHETCNLLRRAEAAECDVVALRRVADAAREVLSHDAYRVESRWMRILKQAFDAAAGTKGVGDMPDDTNRRVAEACGIDVLTDIIGSIYWIENNCCRYFRPDSLHADAVLAAEKFGLFLPREDSWCDLHWDGKRWEIADAQSCHVLGSGTFCGAICEAILKLSETNHPT